MEITLTHADIDDLPVLAEINRLSYLLETANQFAWKNWPDEAGMLKFFMARVKERFSHPDTLIFKTIDTATGEVVGFLCWTREHGSEDKSEVAGPVPTPTATANHQMPAELNMEFIVTTGAEVEKLRSYMEGEHY
ncbi:hypothetical protein MMC14_005765, partial [Varicellaria rhodocarpa]|nr:hypothetical protein [Varicellaria rhodocarpa]